MGVVDPCIDVVNPCMDVVNLCMVLLVMVKEDPKVKINKNHVVHVDQL
jgi:hypothetical protein